MNFKFADDKHEYKYTSADSQLLMTFNNKEIVVETWDVEYIKDPFKVFENLNDQLQSDFDNQVETSVSWIIYNNQGIVEENSGFNGFNGGSKLSKANNSREKE